MSGERVGFVVGFVAFNPGPAFLERLKLLGDIGYKVYVFDNSPKNIATRRLCNSLSDVHYSTAGNNVGLGIGLSVITATAYSDGHRALLFFDQDTVFTSDTLEYIAAFDVACSPRQLKEYVEIAFDAKRNPTNDPYKIERVMLAISSGSLFLLEQLKNIGWHNPTYFVDGVDYELCLRARSRGYRVGRFGGAPGFDHESEQPDQFVKVLGKRIPLRRYSATRIKDSASAYSRLIFSSLTGFDFRAAWAISRSFMIFLLGQLVARVALWKAS